MEHKIGNQISQTARPLAEGGEWLLPQTDLEQGILVYVHGGSFLYAAAPMVTDLAKRLANHANMALVMPHYPLAPEHPCPAAVTAIGKFLADLTLTSNAPIALFAEQAGANLALAALQAANPGVRERISAMVLMSPWLDLSLSSWSFLMNQMGDAHVHSRTTIELAVRLYLGEGKDAVNAANALASPLRGDLAHMPPTLVHACGSDLTLDDSRRLVQRLNGHGIDAQLHEWPRVQRMWERYDPVFAKPGMAHSLRFLARHMPVRA